MLSKSGNSRKFRKCKQTMIVVMILTWMYWYLILVINLNLPYVTLKTSRQTIQEAEREVDSHYYMYQHIQGEIYHDVITKEGLIQYIKRLKVKCAPGIHGITVEHS